MQKKGPVTFNRLSPAAFQKKAKRPLVLVLDNVRSGHNVGAAFRLADAFLLAHIYLCGITPQPPHKQIHKTALGAEEVVSWTYEAHTTHLLKRLKKSGYHLVGVEQTKEATPLQALQEEDSVFPCALVFGHEVFGVDEAVLKIVDRSVEILQYGTKFSMNVSVCMGIVVWELLKNWS